MQSFSELTPQERLALSRKALVRHMVRHRQTHEDDIPFDINDELSGDPAAPGGTLNLLKYAARAWWRQHPASMVTELARPLLDDYAKVHPFKLLGISAGVGAALVVIRPWRMVSMGVLLTGLKSSGLAHLLASLPRNTRPDSTDTP
jgi:hypothetical protein